MKGLRRIGCCLWLACALCPLRADSEETEEFPTRPIRVIVPFGAGGNSDTVARVIQRVIADHALLPEPLVIQNVPGAGGTIGSRRALQAQPNGYTLLFLHEGILTARYSGAASWGWRDFEAIAATGRNGGVIVVADDSPYHRIDELLNAATTPDSLTFATNIGAPAHFWALLLEDSVPGARFRFVQSGGGAARFHALGGGHVNATAFSVSEFLSYRDAGLRAVAILSATRDPQLPGVATAREQGIDVVTSNLQCWWAPKGTPKARLGTVAEALRRAVETPEFRAFAAARQIEPLFLTGDELRGDLSRRETAIAAVAPRATASLPNVPLVLGLLTILAGIGAARYSRQSDSPPPNRQGQATRFTLSTRRASALVALTLGFAAALQFSTLPFALPTLAFLLATAWLLRDTGSRIRTPQAIGFLLFAITLAFGLPWVFGTVFGIMLP